MLLLLFLLITLTRSWDCIVDGNVLDFCFEDSHCNSNSSALNYCDITDDWRGEVGWGTCHCSGEYAGFQCEYKRYDKDLVGGLQFLSIIGVGGIGNFRIGETEKGTAQAVLSGFLFIAVSIAIVWGCCCCGEAGDDKDDACFGIMCYFTVWPAVLYLIGMIWSIVDAAAIFRGEVTDSEGCYPMNSPYIS